MEVEDSSESTAVDQRISVAESIWKTMIPLLISIFSDLNSQDSMKGLLSFLNSMLRSDSGTYHLLLIPSFGAGECLDVLRNRYSAFTNWLFRALFIAVCRTGNKEILESSIEAQSTLLRFLSQHHLTGFEFISTEYLLILDEILDFDEIKSTKNSITIDKFIADRNAIENLDLPPFPITLTSSSSTRVQISIMEIIIKSSASQWNQDDLWSRLLRISRKSETVAKLKAMEIVVQILQFGQMDRKKIEIFVNYSIEIIGNVNNGGNTCFSSTKSTDNFSVLLINVLEHLETSPQVMNLAFAILDTLLNENSTSKHLEREACAKIRDRLINHPRSYSVDDVKKFMKYLEQCPDFYRVLSHYIVYELQSVASGTSIDLTDFSKLWKLFADFLKKKIASFEISELPNLFKAPRHLLNWMVKNRIRGRLFKDPGGMFQGLMQILEAGDQTKNSIVFECLIEMMAIPDFDKNQLQAMLVLPWCSEKSVENSEIKKNFHAMAKCLAVDIKKKCLTNVCEFGRGKDRIKYLSTCVTNSEMELGVAAVTNSIFLLQDPDVSFLDISTHVLKPAFIKQRPQLQEALAKVLGPIVCYLSGKAKFEKKIWDSSSSEWKIHCPICDDMNSVEPAEKFPIEGNVFAPYFALLSSKSIQIRKNISENLTRLSNHLKIFNKNEFSQLWLPYIRDCDDSVRKNLSNSIMTLMKNKIALAERRKGKISIVEGELPKEVEFFVEKIFEEFSIALDDALENSKESLHLTLLTTAKELARVQLDPAERRICNIFLITVIHSSSPFNAVAAAIVAYKEVAKISGLTPRDLYTRYRKEKMHLIMKLVAKNFLEGSSNISTSLQKVVQCIGFPLGARDFLKKDGHLAVCYLVPMVLIVPEIEPLFADIAHNTLLNHSMFVKYFPYICAHVYLNETPEDGKKCLQMISKITDHPLRDLMRRSYIFVTWELLIYFHDKMERVMTCLEALAELDPESSRVEGNFEPHETVMMYLTSKLHGILLKFDEKLRPMTDQSTQKACLASLGSLMKYMGPKNLSPLRYKILASLRTSLGLTRPGFRKICCYAWDCFIRSIPLEDLGPLLPTIAVSMIPLLETCPKEVNSMLEFLLVKNNAALGTYISEIFFIKDLKVDNRIVENVSPYIKRSTPSEFEEGLKIWLRRIKHETDEVRLKALTHLQEFLGKHRNHLNAIILKDTNVHPLVGELLDGLLAGCKDKEESIRLLSGECLGELGAVEPSLRGRRIANREDSKFISSLKNDDFVTAILTELAMVIPMEKITSNVDCFALAIQQISRTFNITQDHSIWKRLTSTCQQIISPFLSSSYTMVALPVNIEEIPIYGSEAGSTFENWVFNWTCYMIDAINDVDLSSMLDACRPALKRDTKTTVFCIPYVFTNIVTTGTDADRDDLMKEISAVIKVSEEELDVELSKWRSLRKAGGIQKDVRVSDEARRVRCSQVIFSILDYMSRWLIEKRLEKDDQYKEMEKFFSKIDSSILAFACYKVNDYHRALMYLEKHMATKEKGPSDPDESGLHAKIYTQLEEPDGVSGILATQDQPPSLQQLVVAHEVNGQLQDAATCYERLAQRSLEPKHIQGLINCYLSLDQPFTAMKITQGILNKLPEYELLIVNYETFWRLADFQQLDNTHEKNVLKNSLLEDLKRGVQPNLQDIKKKLVSQLGAISHEGAYQQNYQFIMKLHIVNEFEKATALMIKNVDRIPEIFDEWEKRDQLIRASRGVEFVMGMRRATLDLAVHLAPEDKKMMLNREIGKIWLKSAKIARKSGLYQQAYMYILSASDYCPTEDLYIEQAQLYWQKGCQEDAFVTLKRLFSSCFKDEENKKSIPDIKCTKGQRNFAKAKLLFAKYNAETLNVNPEKNMKYYKDAVGAWSDWEKSWLMYAEYIEANIKRMTDDERNFGAGLDQLFEAFTGYGKSLQFGCKYLHQSLPRLISIWMDLAQGIHSKITEGQSLEKQKDVMKRMSSHLEGYRRLVPSYVWLTALSHLVSRICHPWLDVQNKIIQIIIELLVEQPQYCLWTIVSIFNSDQTKEAAGKIRNSPEVKEAKLNKLIEDFSDLGRELIKLSNEPLLQNDKVSVMNIMKMNKDLPKLLLRKKLGPIMIPTSKFFELLLPPNREYNSNHRPFQNQKVSIIGMDAEVRIYHSLVKPRRITLNGSDGKKYRFLCKPRDDLRRDSRVMEFNAIFNTYLQKDPESRQRRLYIRTYCVVPLSEKCGLIEWLDDLIGLRPALTGLYKERKLGLDVRNYPPRSAPLETKRKAFLGKFLPKHPPFFGEWFRINFPDPHGWYEARTAYIRTTAVMSMVGYILGLGDRHGENISFDRKCGDCVHVDVNCLFNEGELFLWPERVPFRLTHNMVDAMGPLKYEGPFKKSCENTMRVLRQKANSLISYLTPFTYTEKASFSRVENVKNMENRLKGIMKPSGGKSEAVAHLSVEGQVEHLILEATNIDNLCRMYPAWLAFM